MTPNQDATLELFGALATCLARAIDVTTLPQIAQLEIGVLGLLGSVDSGSASATVFRSTLRQITDRKTLLTSKMAHESNAL